MATRIVPNNELPLPLHPLAMLLPPMSTGELESLRRSMADHGQLVPVMVNDNQVVDGRHRMQVAQMLGRDLVVDDVNADSDLARRSLTANVARRHLSDSQRAMIAARLVTTTRGHAAGINDVTQAGAADMLGVSTRYVRDACWLIATQNEQVIDEVWGGMLSLRAAVASLRVPVQRVREARESLIDRFPDTPIPALDQPLPEGVDCITAAVMHIARSRPDAAAWAHSLPEERAAALVIVLEEFARVAYDTIDEEVDIAPAAPASSRVNDEADAMRNVRVGLGNSATGGACVTPADDVATFPFDQPARTRRPRARRGSTEPSGAPF